MAMSQTEQEFHRKVAVECFNKTWDYFEKKERTLSDEQTMLNLAHSSRYHWSFVGTALHFVVGDWQVSLTYSALKQPDLAITYADTPPQPSPRLTPPLPPLPYHYHHLL